MPTRSRAASRRGARCCRRGSAKISARARGKIIPSGSHGSARSVVWRDAAMRPGSTPDRRSTWTGSRRNAATRRKRYTSLGPSMPTPTPPMLSRPKPTTSRPWPWPMSLACARSWPTATTGWAGCTARPAGQTSPRRAVCRYRVVPRHGHDLLGAPGGSRAGAGRWSWIISRRSVSLRLPSVS
jgi:hypothetical protein